MVSVAPPPELWVSDRAPDTEPDVRSTVMGVTSETAGATTLRCQSGRAGHEGEGALAADAAATTVLSASRTTMAQTTTRRIGRKVAEVLNRRKSVPSVC
jgi:hypothetical protein